jgi:hypothetical protein
LPAIELGIHWDHERDVYLSPLRSPRGSNRGVLISAFYTMPGPWVDFLRDPDYAKSCQWANGDVIEMVCLDDDSRPQGFALMVVEKSMKKRLHRCHTIQVSDKEYAEWLFDDERAFRTRVCTSR